MKSIIEEIKLLGYDIKKTDIKEQKFYMIISPTGVTRPIPSTNENIFIGVGECKDLTDAEMKVKSGIGLKTTGNKIYKEIYTEPEEYCEFTHRCTLRTWNYLKNEMSNIGLISMEQNEFNEYLPEEELLYTINNPFYSFINTNDINMYFINNEYVASFICQYDIDTFPEYRFTFKKEPTEEQILTAIVIHKIKSSIGITMDESYFSNWIGEKIHWLDVDGDICEKYEKYINR